ncbi:hypothetical protein [Limnoglobus roseus]|uniref:Uncharacterized protein n=1 Tax=Limnoglobus roseus TaxID=2598579 RepID=A0A5C1AKU4_9BACT|nr:hypothetical protein [Limnoglobus roseus]QEL17784.1 hypothetical protein PX52LOC_04792 [Limnoglobus roseus]
MDDTHGFAADVFHTVCARLAGQAADLAHLVATDAPFDGWLEGEAYLACRSAGGRFGEVEFRPTYGSEGVTGADGRPSAARGGLRVGGVGDPGHHLWLFAEFVVAPARNGRNEDWQARTEAAIARLLGLGWKRSAALLIVLAADSRDGEPADVPSWGQPPLTDAVLIPLPGGGSVVVRAFDVKPDPADTLAGP